MSTSAQMLVVPELKDILFATDFSPCAQAALPFLRTLALCCASTVHVVHVIPHEEGSSIALQLAPELDAEHREADHAIQSLLASDAFRGTNYSSAVEWGKVGEVLTRLAEKKHVGLIVLGTHGRSGLKRLVLGSTAEQVIRMAPCPVLTIGPQACSEATAQPKWGPIIGALDFEAGPHPALPFAASLARANHVPLILLHAVPPNLDVPQGNLDSIPFNPAFSAELTERVLGASKRQMEEIVSAEQLQDLEPQLIVEIGPPADTILRTAQKRAAGLIVMGAHRTRMLSAIAHLPWATISAVLCEAPCPVITIRD